MRMARNCRPAPMRWPIALGFVVATGLLHLAGIAFGLLARWPAGRFAVRGAGGLIALAGVVFLAGWHDRARSAACRGWPLC